MVPTIVHDLVAAGVDPVLLRSLDRLIMGGSEFDQEQRWQPGTRCPLVASYRTLGRRRVWRMQIGDSGAARAGIDLQVGPDGGSWRRRTRTVGEHLAYAQGYAAGRR